MSRPIVWSEDAEDDLKRAPDWRLAATVASAVVRFAEEGVGFARHVRVEDGPDEFRLQIPGLRTYVLFHATATALYVERAIFRV